MSAARQAAALGLFLVLCFGAAWIGSRFTIASLGPWYDGLRKPGFNPPAWVFGPVWSVLYALMAFAAWWVWREGGGVAAVRPALAVFLLQLALNVGWSGVFFGLRLPGWALVELALLWAAILATTVLFWQRSAFAGALLLPYIAWVSFAGVLNAALWRLNA